jgi:hypothetical protein
MNPKTGGCVERKVYRRHTEVQHKRKGGGASECIQRIRKGGAMAVIEVHPGRMQRARAEV